MSAEPLDVCLVNMPYAPIRVPSLALGILHSILEQDGFSVSSVYANILFFNELGLKCYTLLMTDAGDNGTADWSFAHIAFPEHFTETEEFLSLLSRRDSMFAKLPEAMEALLSARDAASRYMDRLIEDTLALRPRIVGCTSSCCQHVPSLAFLKKIHEAAPDVITMLGGANCESIMGKATHELFPWIDYVVSGEAEDLISPLCRGILAHGRDLAADALPEGVFGPIHRKTGYPTGDGNNGPPRSVTRSLKGLPVPNYYQYFVTVKESPLLGPLFQPGLLVEGARGCWWKQSGGCSWCGLNGVENHYRPRPVAEVLNELKVLSERHGIRQFEFVDNALGRGFVKTLIPKLIELGSPYNIFYEIRVDLTRDQVADLRKAGVNWVQAGIESFDSRLLKLMNKGTECWQNIQLLKWASQFGVRCIYILLYGIPDEDDAWYEEMASHIPLLTHLQPPGWVAQVRYHRFSTYESRSSEYGLKLFPTETDRAIYPLAEHQLENLVVAFDEAERLKIMRNPILSFLLEPRGLKRVKQEQEKWRLANPPHSLVMKANGEDLTIIDSRNAAVEPEMVLRGLARDVYLTCDDAPKVETLMDTFAARGFRPEEVEDVIKDLIGKKILLAVDGRYIALALRDPVIPLAPRESFPGGGYFWQGAKLPW